MERGSALQNFMEEQYGVLKKLHLRQKQRPNFFKGPYCFTPFPEILAQGLKKV